MIVDIMVAAYRLCSLSGPPCIQTTEHESQERLAFALAWFTEGTMSPGSGRVFPPPIELGQTDWAKVMCGRKIEQFRGTAVTGSSRNTGFTEKDVVDCRLLAPEVGYPVESFEFLQQPLGKKASFFAQGQPLGAIILAGINLDAKGLDLWFHRFAEGNKCINIKKRWHPAVYLPAAIVLS